MAEDFDAMEVCCETVVTCVGPEICNCLFSRFIFVAFPCGFDVNVFNLISNSQLICMKYIV